MSVRPIVSGLLMFSLLCPQAALAAQSQSPSLPQAQHVVDAAALRQAMAAKVSVDRENRKAVLKVLDRRDVQGVGARMGLDIKRARAAVASVEGEQLANLANAARDADRDLAGGNKTVTISVTTLLLLLILIVLIVD